MDDIDRINQEAREARGRPASAPRAHAANDSHHVTKREFKVYAEQERERLVAFLGRQRTPFQVNVGPIKHKRSNTANARLWLLHGAACEITGDEPEDLHEKMLCKFTGSEVKEVKDVWTGELIKKEVPLERSSDMEPERFRLFMDFCEHTYGSYLNVWLPNKED